MSFASPFYIHFVLHFTTFIYWAFSIFTLFSTFHMAIYLLFLTSYCPSYTFFSGWNSTQYRHLASHTFICLHFFAFTSISWHYLPSHTFVCPFFGFTLFSPFHTFIYSLFSTFTYFSISHGVTYLHLPPLSYIYLFQHFYCRHYLRLPSLLHIYLH